MKIRRVIRKFRQHYKFYLSMLAGCCLLGGSFAIIVPQNPGEAIKNSLVEQVIAKETSGALSKAGGALSKDKIKKLLKEYGK